MDTYDRFVVQGPMRFKWSKPYNVMQSNDDINAPQKMWDEDHSSAEERWK